MKITFNVELKSACQYPQFFYTYVNQILTVDVELKSASQLAQQIFILVITNWGLNFFNMSLIEIHMILMIFDNWDNYYFGVSMYFNLGFFFSQTNFSWFTPILNFKN